MQAGVANHDVRAYLALAMAFTAMRPARRHELDHATRSTRCSTAQLRTVPSSTSATTNGNAGIQRGADQPPRAADRGALR